MKVLFISSGNSVSGLSPIVANQASSLKKSGVDVDFYTVNGKGIISYLKNIFPLRRKIIRGNYDVLHAHYSYSAFVATLTFRRPLVVSLLGSDVYKGRLMNGLIRYLSVLFWDACIVKSPEMKLKLKLTDAWIIPNGVDMNKFMPMDIKGCRKKLDWDPNKKHILFAANPERSEKNFLLAEKALSLLNDVIFELHFLKNIPNDEVVFHYNAADVILLTSSREGSPNVIKEALACDRPIVATGVGDIPELLNSLEGCYRTGFSPQEISESVRKALLFEEKIKGRQRLTDLKLEESVVASSIIEIYKKILKTE